MIFLALAYSGGTPSGPHLHFVGIDCIPSIGTGHFQQDHRGPKKDIFVEL